MLIRSVIAMAFARENKSFDHLIETENGERRMLILYRILDARLDNLINTY